MKRFFIIAFFWISVLLAACSKPNSKSCPQEDLLYQLECVFSKNPDSVLKILDTLNVDVLSEKERAHYCLVKAFALDGLFRYDATTDSLMQDAARYFIGSDDKFHETEICEGLSRLAFKMGKGDDVQLEWLQKAMQSIEQCKHVDERIVENSFSCNTEQDLIEYFKNKIHLRLGMFCLDRGYEDEGFLHVKLADQYFAESQNHKLHSNTALMLGTAYLTRKDYDSCLIFYHNGLEAAELINDTSMIANYHGLMAMYYRQIVEYENYENEKKQQLLRQAIAEGLQGLGLYKGAMFRYKDGIYDELSKAYFQLQQYDSCIYFSEKQIAFYKDHHMEMVPNTWNADIYSRLYQSHEALGHTEEALKYAHSYFEMKKAIDNQPQAVEKVKNEYDKKLEMQQLQAEQRARRLRLYVLLSLLVATLAIVLAFAYRYRKQKEIETLKAQEAYMKLQSDLETTEQHSLQVLQQRVMELYKSKQPGRTERILAEFAAVYPQAMEKLQAEHPELMEAKRNIVILSFLGFRIKEEAELLGLSANTVTKYRTNIRKKIGKDLVFSLSM